MNEPTLEPPELGSSLDLSTLGPADEDRVRVTWATFEGRRVVVKSARGRHRAVLRREAEALRRLTGPHVVDLVAVLDDEERTALVLADAGHRTLADPDDLDPDALLRAFGRSAEAVAGLHRMGWSHGRLEPGHVILTARGRVRLCSLAAARPIGSAEDRAADVAALLGVGSFVADELERRGRREARVARGLRSTLGGLEADPGLDAERLTAALVGLRGRRSPLRGGGTRRGARARARRAPSASRPRPASISPRGLRTAVVSIVLFGLGTVAAVAFPDDGSADPVIDSLASARSADTAAVPSSQPMSGSQRAAPTVAVDGRTYRVGSPGDRVASGDWDCDGAATVRLLRPSTGELFEFGPADPGGATTHARVHSLHPGAVDLVAEPRPEDGGCHLSVLLGPDGRRQEIS